jgi:hypothetical protein
VGIIAAAGSFAVKGRGHALEPERPIPFVAPVNALTRIFAEQFITFPRFVLSGGCGRAYRMAGGLSDRRGP